jgi:hypothetical protein
MKTLRYILFIIAALFGISAIPIPCTIVQISKNMAELANMRDVVKAICVFQENNNRLPDNNELSKLSHSLPGYSGCTINYDIQTMPEAIDGQQIANWPASNAWMITYWKGEWNERYTSWNNKYSLEDKLTWRYYWKPFWDAYKYFPLISVILFVLGIMIKTKPNNRPIPYGLSVTPPAEQASRRTPDS